MAGRRRRRRWRWLGPGDRERVLVALRAGGRVVDVAAAFDVGRTTVYRIRDAAALAGSPAVAFGVAVVV
jgi:hypothetical protein